MAAFNNDDMNNNNLWWLTSLMAVALGIGSFLVYKMNNWFKGSQVNDNRVLSDSDDKQSVQQGEVVQKKLGLEPSAGLKLRLLDANKGGSLLSTDPNASPCGKFANTSSPSDNLGISPCTRIYGGMCERLDLARQGDDKESVMSIRLQPYVERLVAQRNSHELNQKPVLIR